MTARRNGLWAVLCPLVFLAAPLFRLEATGSSSDLEHAIRSNDLTSLQKLTAVPGVVRQESKLKNTPLHYAVLYGSAQTVRVLLAAGADPNVRNQAGASPLLYAAWDFERARLLVEHGADVNAADARGTTPLMVAASAHNNAKTVGYLLDKGARVNALDGFGNNALTRSDFQSDRETVSLLLSHGADARLCNRAGMNALAGSVGLDDTERIRILLAAGADPNKANQMAGRVRKGPLALLHLTPLMLAAPYDEPDIIAALLKAGAQVNDVDIRKMNAITFAIATDHANPAVVRQLIAAGADVNAVDQNGEGVLTWARKYRDPEIMRLLEAAGAKGKELVATPQPDPGSQAANAGDAIRRTLPLLASSGQQFFRESACAGCHHQAMQARAYAASATAGLQPDPALRRSFLDSMTAVRPLIAPGLPVLDGPGGDYDTLLAYLTAYADLGEPPNELTDLMLHYVAVRQDPGGAWINLGIARPPIEDSTITRTAIALRALKRYSWPARQTEFYERIERGRSWLQRAQPVTTYERADQIAGLAAAGVTANEQRGRAEELLRLQHADGGWAQTRFLDSDAYATGLVLYTLYTAGLAAPHDAAYQRGVQFLLRTQFRDGSWYVRSRAPKFQPYFQSGFPFDHDQWISSAATGLAVMALAPAASTETQARLR